jgi:aspartyl-tRNA synthetase
MEAMKVVGYSEEEVHDKFKHMLEAYTYGAPTHAGFAWGIDRLFMVLLGEENIREVIAFPKNGSGLDLMTNSPSSVSPRLLKELSIKLD